MCLVCIDFEKGKLTKKEALKNLSEMAFDKTSSSKENLHYFEVINDFISKEYENEKSKQSI